ncbi:hypothetical protein, partial [Bacteroides thetaiotaomicron]
MSLQQVAWLCMQGFTTKYYLCEAERGDFIVNLQVTTLHTIKTWQIPLRHNSHQADRKLICEHVGVYSVRMCVKGVYEVKSIAAKREKRQELIFS